MGLDVVTVGDSVVDILIPVPRFPEGDEDSVPGERMERQLGGASNFLIQASRLGLSVGIIDCVGDDELGRFYMKGLESEGVDVSRIRIRAGLSTAHCIVLVDRRGRHAYIGFEGATRHLTPKEVDHEYVSGSRLLYISGYAVVDSPIREAALRAVEIASESGIPIFFDPGPKLTVIPMETLNRFNSVSRMILLNEREMDLMEDAASIGDAARGLLRKGPEAIILKRGKAGCLICTGSGSMEVPGYRVKAVDTTGAGDAFNASFIYGYLRGWSLRKSAVLANAVGAVKVTKMGAGTRVPTKEEVVRFLSTRQIGLNDL